MTETTIKNPVKPHPHRIIDIHRETDHDRTFKVEYDGTVEPGQFMQLSIPKIGEAPISVSGQGEGWLSFTMRSVGHVTDHIFQKEPGDSLFLRGPYGRGWPMEKFMGKHVVTIAGGTGLSPLRMLLRHFLEHPEDCVDVTVLVGYKDHNNILFREDLDRWSKTPHFKTGFCLDNEEMEGWTKGFVTCQIANVPFKEWGDNYAVAVVGPPPMMHFTGLELLKQGADEQNIWMSFERKMSCAIGKCGNCRIDETYVCQDGPVFPYRKAKYLVD